MFQHVDAYVPQAPGTQQLDLVRMHYGLSDHNVVVLRPKARVRPRAGTSRKLVARRDTRDSK